MIVSLAICSFEAFHLYYSPVTCQELFFKRCVILDCRWQERPCQKLQGTHFYDSPIETCHMASLSTSDTSHTTGWIKSCRPSVRAACIASETCGRALLYSAIHWKLIVLFPWISMWNILIPEEEEAHQPSASLSMVKCTRCENLFFTLKGMSWYTLTIRFLRIDGCGCPLNLNNIYFFLPECI